MSAFFKIPLQALILLTGVLMFVFFLFNKGPMLFNRAPLERCRPARARPSIRRSTGIRPRVRGAASHAAQALRRQRRGDTRTPRAAFVAADADVRAVRQRAIDARAARPRSTELRRRELRVSDLRRELHAHRPRRA